MNLREAILLANQIAGEPVNIILSLHTPSNYVAITLATRQLGDRPPLSDRRVVSPLIDDTAKIDIERHEVMDLARGIAVAMHRNPYVELEKTK